MERIQSCLFKFIRNMQSRDNDFDEAEKEREQITIKYPRMRQEEKTHFHFILFLDESFKKKRSSECNQS